MPRFLAVLATLLCLVLFTSSAHGWWCKGHMLVAEVARRHLKPEVADIVDRVTSTMSASGPYPKSTNMVELACWSDDLKSFGLQAMNDWHFIDTPYNPSNITIKGSPVDKMNVVTVTESLAKTLKRGKHIPVSVVGFALAHLIHFYGDVHQPLHTTSLFSAAFPNGDRGGNLVKVIVKNATMSLHSLWDSICQGSEVPLPRPLSDDDYSQIKEFANYLESTYDFTDSQKEDMQVSHFAEEGYEMAVQTVYNGITNGMHVTNDYLQKCKSSAESRVTLAGYRLATRLNNLFSTDSDAAKDKKRLSWVWNNVRRAKKMLLRSYG